MRLFRVISFILSFFCLLAALWSIPFGIFHIGNVVLLVLAVLLFLLPFWWKGTRKHKVWRTLLTTGYALGFGCIATISVMMLWQAYNTPPPTQGDYTVVVLGCGLQGDQPSLMLRRRLNATARYLNANPEATCIVSGGQGHDEVISEAQAMATYLESIGIDPSRIQMEDQSTNTRENLRFSMALLPESSLGTVIATDGFHQLRASITAKSLGMEPVYAISSVTPWGLLPSYWMRDLGGVPLTWLEENGILSI